jgi:hypothetical protein
MQIKPYSIFLSLPVLYFLFFVYKTDATLTRTLFSAARKGRVIH